MALGIHVHMNIAYGDPAVRDWVIHPKYLRNQLVPGAVRIDLDGKPAGTVTQAERETAYGHCSRYVHGYIGRNAKG